MLISSDVLEVFGPRSFVYFAALLFLFCASHELDDSDWRTVNENAQSGNISNALQMGAILVVRVK